MATNQKQIDLLRNAAEARLSRAGLGRLAPAGVRHATGTNAGAGSVPSRWADGTPRKRNPKTGQWETDRLAQLRETLDIERVNAGDQRYIAAHAADVQELLQAEQTEVKKGLPPDSVIVSEADRAAMLYDLRVQELDEKIQEFEARKAALEPPPTKKEEK